VIRLMFYATYSSLREELPPVVLFYDFFMCLPCVFSSTKIYYFFLHGEYLTFCSLFLFMFIFYLFVLFIFHYILGLAADDEKFCSHFFSLGNSVVNRPNH